MGDGQYYVHNLSPFIFQVSGLDFDWLKTPLGAIVTAVVVLGGAGLLWFLKKRAARQGSEQDVIGALTNFLEIPFYFAVAALVVLFGLKTAGIEWGLRWYSTMYLLGFMFTYISCRHWIRRRRIMLTPLLLDSLIAYLIIGMILGARAAYVFIYNWDSYKTSLADVAKVWEGGLSFHGGIVGVVIALVIFTRRHGIPFWHLADRLCLTVPFGIAMGRLGNFMNGELYGRVIGGQVPWAVVFPSGGPQPRHPSQIYQSLGEGWLLLLSLHLVHRIKGRHQGLVGVAFIFFYGLFRYFVEFFREADEQLKYYFSNTTTMGQILCGITMLVALTLYIVFVRENPKEDSPELQAQIDDFLKRRDELESA
jgi:phosphatidylglycerol:prolipoprotein diacylglycerol transferase